MTRFAILAVPRTGSNLLCTLLNSHPEILCHHELFNPQGIFLALSQRDRSSDLPSLHERDVAPVAFLDKIWQAGREHPCVGFKWTRGQSTTVLEHVVQEREIIKIVLRRRNRVKTYVSAEIAQATQQWEAYSQQELTQPRPRVTVENAQLRRHISENERFYADLRTALERTQQSAINLCYENLFSRDEQRRLLQLLGVSGVDQPLTAASVKQNPTSLGDVIANFAELAADLAGSDLEAELYDSEM